MTSTARKIESVLIQYETRLTQYERDFLVSMAASSMNNQQITQRQQKYLQTLVNKVEVWERLDYLRKTSKTQQEQ